MLEGPNCTQIQLPQPSQRVPARPWVLAGVALSFSCPLLEGDTGHFAPPQGWVLLGAVLGVELGGFGVGFPCEMS